MARYEAVTEALRLAALETEHLRRASREWRWRGAGRSVGDPAVWTPAVGLVFGGRWFPAGVEVSQFESANFGWTVSRDETGLPVVAKE